MLQIQHSNFVLLISDFNILKSCLLHSLSMSPWSTRDKSVYLWNLSAVLYLVHLKKQAQKLFTFRLECNPVFCAASCCSSCRLFINGDAHLMLRKQLQDTVTHLCLSWSSKNPIQDSLQHQTISLIINYLHFNIY